MDVTYVLTPQALATGMAWMVVCLATLLAIFHPSIHDTICERIGLCAVSYTTFAAAYRSIYIGYVSDAGFLLALSLAFYAVSIVIKHTKKGGRYAQHRYRSK